MKTDKRKGLFSGYRKAGPTLKFTIMIAVLSVILSSIYFLVQLRTGATKEAQEQAQADRDIKHHVQVENIEEVKNIIKDSLNILQPNEREKPISNLVNTLKFGAVAMAVGNIGSERLTPLNGFIVSSQGYIVTVDIFDKVNDIQVVSHYNKEALKGRLIKQDKEKCLALIKCDFRTEVIPLVLESEVPNNGDEIFALNSFSSGMGFMAIPGKVLDNTGRYITGKFVMARGSAGTPCVNDEGRLVGMILLRDEAVATKKLVSSKEILDFVQELSAREVLNTNK